MQVIPPGGAKEWHALLPSAYARDPYVVVVTPPVKAMVIEAELPSGVKVEVCEWDGKKWGLQVTEPKLKTYPAHQEVFDAIGIPMLPPRYIGKVSAVPSSLLCSKDFAPLILLRDAMNKPYLHVRRHIARLTQEVNDATH